MSIKQRSSVRIISGLRKGARVSFVEAPGLRPSGDRIREMLFSWLQTTISGSVCLDMFAGSGALGFEAASRGASSVIMLESNIAVKNKLEENCRQLQFNDVQIHAIDALKYTGNQSQFDIVFIDPPFAERLHQAAIDLLSQQQMLQKEALVYVEIGKRQPLPVVPANWQLHKDKTAGEVRVQLYRVIAAQ